VRLLLCALAIIAISGLGQSAHLVLVRHLRCIHGALVHAAPAPAPQHERPAASPSKGGAADQGVGVVGHQHCRHALVRAAAVTPPPVAALARLLAWSPTGVPGSASATRPPVALLHLAPKLSPPRG